MTAPASFTLPNGYLDNHGVIHRTCQMRLALATDELSAFSDPRVRASEAFLSVALLSRVVTGLGTIKVITPAVIEGLYSEDFALLQELYMRINKVGRSSQIATWCPLCKHPFHLNLNVDSP